MRLQGWATACAAAVLLSSCGVPTDIADPPTTSSVGDAGDGSTVVSIGALSCRLPDSDQARTQTERLMAAETQFSGSGTDKVAFAVHDYQTGVTCSRNDGTGYEAASIIKVATVAALLWQIEQDPWLEFTTEQEELATAAITISDNDAQEMLWELIGGSPGLELFLAAAWMSHTTTDPDGAWGLTSTTAGDQLLLLDVLVDGELLSAGHRAFLLGLMRDVDLEQVWGVSSGAPAGASIALKNGWLDDPVYPGTAGGDEADRPQAQDGAGSPQRQYDRLDSDTDDFDADDFDATWTNNSIGYISSATAAYSLAVLSDGNVSDEAGRQIVSQTSRLVVEALLG